MILSVNVRMAVGVTMASRFINIMRMAMRLTMTMVFINVRDDSYSFLIILNELNYP